MNPDRRTPDARRKPSNEFGSPPRTGSPGGAGDKPALDPTHTPSGGETAPPALDPQPRAASPQHYGELVRQYLELRDQHPGVILLFRVGSFYEVLFDDAELVARELGLKLGERPSGGLAKAVPQCGFAHHALDSFLPRLLARGYRVAVCEESANDDDLPPGDSGKRQRGAGTDGSIRERDVVRTLTPGTVTDPRLLREDRPTYLVAIAAGDERFGLAWTDVAAGEFRAGEFGIEDAAAELQRLDPAEVLVPSDRPAPPELLARRNVTPVGQSDTAAEILQRAFPDAELASLPLARTAAGIAVGYLEQTQNADVLTIDRPAPAAATDGTRLDSATQRHLELVETERGKERAGSLLGALDRTVTPMGRRMLRDWILRPLIDLRKIHVRQRLVAELVEQDALRTVLVERLERLPDLERLAGRAGAQRASLDDLRELAGLAGELPELAQAASEARTSFLRSLGRPRAALAAFAQQADRALAPAGAEHPVRPEASASLAKALADLERAVDWQRRYLDGLRRQPGLARVKIERTSTQGLFLEVPVNTNVPDGWVRRGGLQRVERYSTPELEQHAIGLAEAETRFGAETAVVLRELRSVAAETAGELRDLGRHLAAADALCSLATVAAERGWVRPTVDESPRLEIEAGRHPVIELAGSFQPNDARLEARGERDQVVVLTGPNMAGKSTWMRQVALIVLLAQAGSFVPAERAHIGLVDAIFTRIGAVDDLAGGRSTFMVEMEETASLLRGVTDRGLVILDEIGRGTSTHDGMAIAWAVVEHLAAGSIRPRAIVATHYHELAALQSVLPQVTLLRAAVEEVAGEVRFPHRIEAGAADRSFGIEVARLAGLPPTVLDRARQVAEALDPLSAEIARHLGGLDGR